MIALKLAFRNVLRRRERSLLTLVGVLLAVGAFVAMVSLAEGMYKRVSIELDGRAVDIYMVPKSAAPLPTGPIGTIGLTTDTINLALIDKIKGISNVTKVCPVSRLQWTGSHGTMMVMGIRPEDIVSFLPSLQLVDGSNDLQPGKLIMGTELAKIENISVGGKFRSGQTTYHVIGLASAGAGFQNYTAFINLKSALKTGDGKGASEIWIQLKDPHRATEVIKRLESFKIPDVKILTRKDYLGAADEYIKYAWMLQCAISAIGVLIAVTAAMNTMLMSTYERMREFGTLRAIGASRLTVATMVVIESVILSFAGGLLGIGFGWLGSILLDQAMVVIMQISFPLASVTPALIVEAMVLSVVVGLIGAAIPSVLVWRIDIVEGLKWN